MIHPETSPRKTHFKAWAFNEYMKIEVPPIDFIVEGLLVEGSAVLMSAREKAGKGLLMIDLAISISLGTPFLGRAVKEGPVIYFALEENIGTLKTRLRARVPSGAEPPFYVVQLDGSMDDEPDFHIDSVEGVSGLLELVAEIQPALVIIDTLREAHRGRENESDDMAPRLRAIRAAAHQTNTTIIITHHAAKMTGGARGSTAIRAAFDDTLEFTRDDNENETSIRGVLRAEGRNLQKVSEHIAFNADSFEWEAVSAPSVVVEPNLRQRILDALVESDDWMLPQDLADAIPGSSLGSIQNQLGRMVQENPRPFAVDNEKPVKGKPRRYHSLEARLIPHYSSHTNDVKNEERDIKAVGRQCVDCGAPTGDESRPYCAKHMSPDLTPTGTEGFVPRIVGEI